MDVIVSQNNNDLSWQLSADTFRQQLSSNLCQLNSKYPNHWAALLQYLNDALDKYGVGSRGHLRFLDIGCGCGAVSEVLYRAFGDRVRYHGIDYSPHAVELARASWKNPGTYEVCGYSDIPGDYGFKHDISYQSALSDVCSDGHSCLRKIMSLGCRYCILQRIRVTGRAPYFVTESAYDIQTNSFYHNASILTNDILSSGYGIIRQHNLGGAGLSLYLKKGFVNE